MKTRIEIMTQSKTKLANVHHLRIYFQEMPCHVEIPDMDACRNGVTGQAVILQPTEDQLLKLKTRITNRYLSRIELVGETGEGLIAYCPVTRIKEYSDDPLAIQWSST